MSHHNLYIILTFWGIIGLCFGMSFPRATFEGGPLVSGFLCFMLGPIAFLFYLIIVITFVITFFLSKLDHKWFGSGK